MLPDFNRKIYCILGLPFDALSMSEAVQHLRDAAASRAPCFLSTPNLNFLIGCQSDISFRDSVINSDLSVADGMPIVWLARLLGIPIHERVAGSDLFEQLGSAAPTPLSVYFFGGTEGIAEAACKRLNTASSGIVCGGFESPGFGSIQDMSSKKSIDRINASGADFLLVSLGAKKGQAWIEHNRTHITVPIISHLGAVINFVAGKLSRAPVWVQRTGLEWLWRIKEEPSLWRRYASDGLVLLKLLITRIVPYVWFRFWHKPAAQELDSAAIELFADGGEMIVHLREAWVQNNLQPLRECFSRLALTEKNIRVELGKVTFADSAFIGLLLLMYADRKSHGKRLSVCNSTKKLRKIFRWSCVEYLLDKR